MKYFVSMIVHFLCIVFSLICLGLYILGIAHYLAGSNDEPNTCESPYMYELPEFMEIAMDDGIYEQFPGFGLYVYGEGDGAEKLRQMEYSGIPVLFVHGHAGSHRQMRSIASVSLKMSLEQHLPFHLDYFTVSLAEGLSAFSGGVIEKQTDFVSICIHRILSLYNGTVDQIVVIGHSMGGVVARAALLRNVPNMTPASVLINLASPYKPLVAFDRTFSNYYDEVNNDEMRLHEMGTSVVVIGGGPRDHQVATSYVIDPHADLNVLSTAIPNVWISTDHLSILWCKQFVIVLVRALFNSVDVNGRAARIISKSEERMKKLKYDLSDRYATGYPTYVETKINFEVDGKWIEITSPNLIFDVKNHNNRHEENKPIYLMIPLNFKLFNYLSLDTINLEANDWLFICKAMIMKDESKACESGWNLTNQTILSPDYQQRLRKTVDLMPQILSAKFTEETHIVIRIPMAETQKTSPPIVYIDMYSREERQVHIDNKPPVWLPPSLGSLITPSKGTAIETQPGTLRYFVNISAIPDAIYIKLNAIVDNDHDSPGYTVIQMREMYNEPNSAISQFYIFDEGNISQRRTLQLQAGNSESSSSSVAEIIISFNPRFRYSIQIARAGVTDRMVNFIKNRAHRLYPTIMCVLLLFSVARIDKFWYSLPITFGITLIASVVLDLCLEICVAICILLILAVILCWAVIFIGTIIHHVIVRFLARPLARFPTSWYDGLICRILNNSPLVAIILLIIFILCRCGALVMLISSLLYFLKLTCIYKNSLENSLMSSVRDFIRKFRRPHKRNSIKERKEEEEDIDAEVDVMNHILLVMIWFLTVGCGIPSILVWLQNSSYMDHLFPGDTIMLGSWIVLTTWSSLGFVKLRIICEYHCYRIDPITITQRLIGWLLLWIAGSNKPVYYQWMIPPIVALFITCHYIRRHCLCLVHCNPRFPELKNL